MKPSKLIPPIIASAALALTASVSSAQETVIHNGESYSYGGFNANIGSVDTSTFTTGSASLLLNYNAMQGNALINGTSQITLGEIDWATDSISFDYKTSSVSRFLRIRLYVGGTNVVVVDHNYPVPTGLPLTTDDTWHSVTLTGTDWTAAYHTAITNGTLNNSTPYSLKIGFQNMGATAPYIGTINIDNIRIGSPIPEPSSFAMLAAAGAGVMVATRRRRRT